VFCHTGQSGILNFTNYHTPAQVTDAINLLRSTYPTLTQLTTIGFTALGQPIRALKISSTPGVNDPTKGDVVFMACHHAREWMSVETTLYIADELLARYATNPEIQADINRLQIWIIPVVNVDGFIHTWSAGGNTLPYSMTNPRYWRKNRRATGGGSTGVDINRNYPYQWGTINDAYNSSSPSSDVYYGPSAGSEPETQVIMNFLDGLTNYKTMLSYHSYSELFLQPWSYTNADAPGETTLSSIRARNINRISAVHAHTYGTSIWYNSAGEATDYTWNKFRAAAFTPEVRPATGSPAPLAGFSPPASEIIPSCEENFAAALALVHDAARTGVWIKDSPGDIGAEPSAGAFWVSPDITAVPATFALGQAVTLNVTVRNNTGVTQNGVTVDVYYTDPRIMLEFPNPNAVLIGSQTINVPPAGTTISMPWAVPAVANSWGELHWCVGVVVKHDRDMPLTTIINRSSNIACKNFNPLPVTSAITTLTVVAENTLNIAAEFRLDIDQQSLPPGVKVEPERGWDRPTELTESAQRKARLLNVSGLILEPGQKRYIKLNVTGRPSDPNTKTAEIQAGGTILPLTAGQRKPLGNGFTYRLQW
jgi:carboxypeptidase T